MQQSARNLRVGAEALVNVARAADLWRTKQAPVTVILEREAKTPDSDFADRVERTADESAAIAAVTKDMTPIERHLFEERLAAWREKPTQ